LYDAFLKKERDCCCILRFSSFSSFSFFPSFSLVLNWSNAKFFCDKKKTV
jgi:hypothetical protein